jgi:hypothetical protein
MHSHRKIGAADARDLAVGTLAFIAADAERLERFLAETGVTPDGIRAAAATPGFLGAVLDHAAGNESLLVAAARALETTPERLMQARAVLSPEAEG